MFGKENSQILITEPSNLVFAKFPIFKLGKLDHFFYRGTKGELANGLLKFTLYRQKRSMINVSTIEVAYTQIPVKGVLDTKKIKFSIPTWKLIDDELRNDIYKKMQFIINQKNANKGIDD